MKKFSLLASALLALCLNASAASNVDAYLAQYANRTDGPRPVHVVSPKVRSYEYGRVRLEFKVSQTGEVRDVQVLKLSGTVKSDAIVAALNDWKFEPRKDQTGDITAEITVRVNS